MANYEEPSLLDFSGNYLHANVQVSFTCALVILHFYLRVCCVCVCVCGDYMPTAFHFV